MTHEEALELLNELHMHPQGRFTQREGAALEMAIAALDIERRLFERLAAWQERMAAHQARDEYAYEREPFAPEHRDAATWNRDGTQDVIDYLETQADERGGDHE